MEQPELPGRIRVLHVIGSGAFSTVWYAWDPELDSPVAVKILADNWSARQDVRERFLSEARLLRRVDADGVVRVYDVGHLADGRPFLVMTYAAGGSLAARLREGPLPPARAQRLLAGVADGLAILHRHGGVHRDLNPHNILLREDTPDSPVLLADLGLAKDLAAASGLTQPGGTGDYRAPEQRDYSDLVSPASVGAPLGRCVEGARTRAGQRPGGHDGRPDERHVHSRHRLGRRDDRRRCFPDARGRRKTAPRSLPGAAARSPDRGRRRRRGAARGGWRGGGRLGQGPHPLGGPSAGGLGRGAT